MKLIRIVPLASLALVLFVAAVAFLSEPELDFQFSEPPDGGTLPPVDLALGAHELVGVIVDGEGNPVDGAGVSTTDAGRPVWTWTDDTGSFVLPELRAGEHEVLVTAHRFQATSFDVEVSDADDAAPLTLTLDRPIGEPPTVVGLRLRGLSGVVDLGPYAAVDGGYELLMLPTTSPTNVEGGFPRRVDVADDGAFEIELLHEGSYRVTLLSPEDRGARTPDLLVDAQGQPTLYEHRVDAEAAQLDLASRAGAIRGVVLGPASRKVGETTSSRRGLRGALVRAERYADDRDQPQGEAEEDAPRERTQAVLLNEFRATRTDEDGRYLLRDLPPGRYRVTVVAGRARRQREVVVPARGAADVDFQTTR
ncbi:MAG: carboxypeptidase-like regulatory domain-containing protein [Planctomycetota bacterium]